jgi:CRISPR-associated endonuclease/helicase Cas3
MGQSRKQTRTYYGHSVAGDSDTSRWELLIDHVFRVSTRCEIFAMKFRAGDWGKLAGLWHDLGKYSAAFQDYLLTANGFEAHLEQKPGRVDHATAGAQLAVQRSPQLGRLLAYVIAGHHSGLADASGDRSCLAERLRKTIEPTCDVPDEILNAAVELGLPHIELNTTSGDVAGFQLAFFTRMLFSSLVDADYLATEEFCDREKSAARASGNRPDIQEMNRILSEKLEEKRITAVPGNVTTCRQQILDSCLQAATKPPGIFSLTVPTGGGKTLSSLAFALQHALQHGKSRIVYAIPFTSIIEQTADVFRDVFELLGNDVVLEHHSNVDPDEDHESPRSRLATENWDAPLVVTTNVQFFESLFAAKTSRCRKLHNLVNSVIILDEAQTLPVDRLAPCLAVLQELVRNYGCTVVLCTATQPAIVQRDKFAIGLTGVTEIISDPAHLASSMRRVEINMIGPASDEELIERMREQDSFLAIVNTRGHAAKLYRDLSERRKGKGIFHLSTLMCGQHRSDTITEIRQRLKNGQTCCVISTQLIEAGVDVDFPVVFRAMTGIDSIAQAAGRCNREGILPSGKVFVFDPKEVRLQGYLSSVAQSGREIAPEFEDILSPAAVQKYFQLHYWKHRGENNWDKTTDQGVMRCFPAPLREIAFDFRTAAERFRLIEEQGQTVFVPYGTQGQKLIDRLRSDGPDRRLLRQLQRYSVTLYDQLFRAMSPDIEMIHGQYSALINQSAYDEKLGVRIDRPGYVEPSALIL